MSEKSEEKKKKKKIAVLWLYVLILLLIIGLLIFLYFLRQKDDVKIALNVSETQTAIEDTSTKFRVLNKQEQDEYIELVGYGLIELDKEYPNVYLENPSGNNAYLSFDVVYKGEVLYHSDLIEPGNMDSFNIFNCLDAGQHTISYIISAYRLTTMKPYWTDVEQIQEIYIYK